MGFPCGSVGEGNGTPLQYSCLENPMDGEAWWAAVHRVTTEQLHFHFSLSCTGEGNGNPLQCSCLENPRDGGAWWAAAFGVAQSRTGLKRLSSSSCGSVVNNTPANAGDSGSVPGLGRSPGEGNGNPLQCSCLEKSMDRGAWRATVPGVAKASDTT